MNNVFKTAILMAALAGIMLALGLLIAGQTGLIIALVLALVFNFISYRWGHRFVLWIYNAKELAPGEHPELVRIVKEVSNKAGIPVPKIYITPTEMPNAFAAGPNPKNSIVACTAGILKTLNEDELKGVLAHEISHIKNRDVLIATIAATVAAVISYIAAMARFSALFGLGGDRDNGPNIIELLLIGILAPLIAMLIQLAISRAREYNADESGAKLLHNGKGLASALQKIEDFTSGHNIQGSTAQETTASLFIANPFKSKSIFKFFSTHPPTEDRIARLKALRF